MQRVIIKMMPEVHETFHDVSVNDTISKHLSFEHCHSETVHSQGQYMIFKVLTHLSNMKKEAYAYNAIVSSHYQTKIYLYAENFTESVNLPGLGATSPVLKGLKDAEICFIAFRCDR